MNDIANVIASEVMMGFLQALTKLCQALFTTSSEALPLDDQEHLASLYVGLLTTTSYWAPGSGSFNAKKDGWLESFWEIATESCRLDLALAGALIIWFIPLLSPSLKLYYLPARVRCLCTFCGTRPHPRSGAFAAGCFGPDGSLDVLLRRAPFDCRENLHW